MPHIREIVDRVAQALGPDAEAAQVEAVVSSVLQTTGPARVLTGGHLFVNLSDCSSLLTKTVRARAYDKIRRMGSHLAPALSESDLGGVLHIATSPITEVAGASSASDIVVLAQMLDDAARDCSASEIAGLTANVDRGIGSAEAALLSSIPEILNTTSRVVVDVRAASPDAGVNVDAVTRLIASLRRFNGTAEDLLRLRLTGSSLPRPDAADGTLFFTADATALIDAALGIANDASLDEVAHMMKATAFGLGRVAARQGDAAAAVLRARSGMDVRFGGVQVDPGTARSYERVVRAAFAASIADGFRTAAQSADVLPQPVAAAFSPGTTDAAAAAWLVTKLAESGPAPLALHAIFSQKDAGQLIHVGPFENIRVNEPIEPDWIRRGGRIGGHSH